MPTNDSSVLNSYRRASLRSIPAWPLTTPALLCVPPPSPSNLPSREMHRIHRSSGETSTGSIASTRTTADELAILTAISATRRLPHLPLRSMVIFCRPPPTRSHILILFSAREPGRFNLNFTQWRLQAFIELSATLRATRH